MKKLMTLAVALGAVFAANAASVSWKVSGTVDTENYKVYLVGAISESWTSVADLATDASAYGANTSGTIAKRGRAYAAGPYAASIDSISKTSADVYFVIVSGDGAAGYNYVKADLSALVYEGAESAPGMFTALTANDLLAGTAGTFGAVPEPTSAMLVLLGVAGLALKRKRA